MKLEDKINIVKDTLKDKKVAIGFSGGADSTLLTYLSSQVAADTLAITIDNHLFPEGFVENAKKHCETFAIKHKVIDINFYDNEEFLKNSSKRCFTCREMMYSIIQEIGKENGLDFICDGNNISDLIADRPGILITYAQEFKTPFIEAKLTSAEIHEYLNKNNISYSKSTTCLATRIPTNTKTTKEKIKKINYCENYILDNTSCEIVKVRDLNETCIIEVDDITEILSENKFKLINDALKSQGFGKVTLNLSEIDDDEKINIDYMEGSFSYRLPYTINLESTKGQIENIISYDEEKIQLDKITVYENGLIKGYDFDDYEAAIDAFMNILQKLRRNI